ncbi:MAG: peptidoglycan -binding protein [Rhodobacteraceae bacterium]|nr:peptidoglycan -binding protein [Paracoccaceae bacterium]
MALSRRTGQRFQGSIWPGFVDAMTGLLLVLMFVLTIFMVIQFVLRETIAGQKTELTTLGVEIAAIADALGLEKQRVKSLEGELGELTATLASTQNEVETQSNLIARLTRERDAQTAALEQATSQITAFEAQVAGLLALQQQNELSISTLQSEKADLLSEQDRLSLALATARSEIDVATEEARRKAAERDALNALIQSLQKQGADNAVQIATQQQKIDDLSTQISQAENDRLLSAAAAEELRKRLENADAELTAMTLALEEQRKKAEETLTLLAAAEAAKTNVETQLADALITLNAQKTDQQTLIDDLRSQNENQAEQAKQAQIALAASLARQQELETRLAEIQTSLDETRGQDREKAQQLNDVQTQLVNALLKLDEQKQTTQILSDQKELIERQFADLQSTLSAQDDLNGSLQNLEAKLTAALAEKLSAQNDFETTQQQLKAALAAKLASDQLAETRLTEAAEREVLLQAAREELAQKSQFADQTTEELLKAERQTALLNQQVGELRKQVEQLQGLLDVSEAADVDNKTQLQNLGQRLNAALARAATEERKRRTLEEAERKRLEEERNKLASQAEDLAKYKSEFFGRMRAILAGQDGVKIVGDRFVFSSEVLFDPGQADLQSAGQVEIQKVATILESVMDEIPDNIDWVIRVDGHTDNIALSGQGQFKDNWELSQARALSVVRYMVTGLGFPPDRLAANGFGEFQPVNDANTESARAQNRRIEIKLTER